MSAASDLAYQAALRQSQYSAQAAAQQQSLLENQWQQANSYNIPYLTYGVGLGQFDGNPAPEVAATAKSSPKETDIQWLERRVAEVCWRAEA